jgi:aryl-alcohol dehydrogenase-like predicted oxidoreductase
MVMEAVAIAERDGLPRYVSEQPPYNLLDRRVENELLPVCRKHGLGVLPWSPLGGGILANRYADGVPDDSRATRRPQVRDRVTPRALEVGRALAAVASERGMTVTQLALLWCKDQPGITAPIIGPRTLEQLDDALAVLTMTLDDETRAACDELVPPGSAVADFHNTAPWMLARLAP